VRRLFGQRSNNAFQRPAAETRTRRQRQTVKKVGIMIHGASPLAKNTRGRALRIADRVNQNLKRYDALPKRGNDLSLVGDLAVLELHALQLSRAIRAFAARPTSKQGLRTFEERLLDLQAQLDNVWSICRHVRNPLRRLVAARCGPEGMAEALLRGISTSMEGVGIDTSRSKRPRSKSR